MNVIISTNYGSQLCCSCFIQDITSIYILKESLLVVLRGIRLAFRSDVQFHGALRFGLVWFWFLVLL